MITATGGRSMDSEDVHATTTSSCNLYNQCVLDYTLITATQ